VKTTGDFNELQESHGVTFHGIVDTRLIQKFQDTPQMRPDEGGVALDAETKWPGRPLGNSVRASEINFDQFFKSGAIITHIVSYFGSLGLIMPQENDFS
jgi:hypothetical protein